MKKLFTFIIVLLIIVSMCACNSDKPTEPTEPIQDTTPSTTEPTEPIKTQPTGPYQLYKIMDAEYKGSEIKDPAIISTTYSLNSDGTLIRTMLRDDNKSYKNSVQLTGNIVDNIKSLLEAQKDTADVAGDTNQWNIKYYNETNDMIGEYNGTITDNEDFVKISEILRNAFNVFSNQGISIKVTKSQKIKNEETNETTSIVVEYIVYRSNNALLVTNNNGKVSENLTKLNDDQVNQLTKLIQIHKEELSKDPGENNEFYKVELFNREGLSEVSFSGYINESQNFQELLTALNSAFN